MRIKLIKINVYLKKFLNSYIEFSDNLFLEVMYGDQC